MSSAASPPAWTLTADEEHAQAEANAHAARDWMQRLGRAIDGEKASDRHRQGRLQGNRSMTRLSACCTLTERRGIGPYERMRKMTLRVGRLLLAIGLGALLSVSCAEREAPEGGHRSEIATPPLRLAGTFDGTTYAREGAANPFPAAGNIEVITVEGRNGGAARFAGHDPDEQGRSRLQADKSAMIWDGANLPVERGTIGFSVRWPGQRGWADGRRTWLVALPPRIHEIDGGADGTGLVVYKDDDDTLVLGIYHAWEKRIHTSLLSWGLRIGDELSGTAPPDAVAIRIPVSHLSGDEWIPVRLAWDRATGRVWLGIGDELQSADADLRLPGWHCLVIGSPPQIRRGPPEGFDGDLADLVIDERTPEQAPAAGLEIPAGLPPPARPEPGRVEAVHLADDPVGGPMEAVVRSHLRQVLRAQGEHGGWAFGVAWPSRMSFLSSSAILPYTANFFNGCKQGNSAACAMRLLAGYLTLDDPSFLEGAERTARGLLKLQQPAGYWPYYAVWDPDTQSFDRIYEPEIAPMEDHVQAHPIALLWLLHDLTGNPEYLDAADRGRDFVLYAQNPNGSWSHQYRPAIGAGWTFGALDAGEINDYATSNQMLVMLAAYRRTGEPKYLAAFLRGADWHVEAFIDRGAVGWAQQYDADNQPIEARDFEPAAVSLGEGISSAPRRLLQAYRLTGDRRYLEPLHRWREWMLANRIFLDEEQTRWGWHEYYDIETGEPFRMVARERRPADPRQVRDGGFTAVLREIETAEEPPRPRVTSEQRARAALAAIEAAAARPEDPVFTRLRPQPLVEALDGEAGTWLFGAGPSGGSLAPSTIRSSLLCWSVLLHRQIAGQLPWDHRLATLDRVEYGSPFHLLIPPDVLNLPLAEDEIAAARAIPPSRSPRSPGGEG